MQCHYLFFKQYDPKSIGLLILFYLYFKLLVLIDISSKIVLCNPDHFAQVPEVKRKDKREEELS